MSHIGRRKPGVRGGGQGNERGLLLPRYGNENVEQVRVVSVDQDREDDRVKEQVDCDDVCQ